MTAVKESVDIPDLVDRLKRIGVSVATDETAPTTYRTIDGDLIPGPSILAVVAHAMTGHMRSGKKPIALRHLFASSEEDKTVFPLHWSRDEVVDAIRHIAQHPVKFSVIEDKKNNAMVHCVGKYRGVVIVMKWRIKPDKNDRGYEIMSHSVYPTKKYDDLVSDIPILRTVGEYKSLISPATLEEDYTLANIDYILKRLTVDRGI